MKNEAIVSHPVRSDSVVTLLDVRAVTGWMDAAQAGSPDETDAFWMDLHRREFTVTSTLEHILHDQHNQKQAPTFRRHA